MVLPVAADWAGVCMEGCTAVALAVPARPAAKAAPDCKKLLLEFDIFVLPRPDPFYPSPPKALRAPTVDAVPSP